MTLRRTTAITICGLALATGAVSAQQARGRSAAWRDIQGFNIVLVVGEAQAGGATTDEIPAGARRALTDMREFLPYKHYRVLDSQWTSCCSPANFGLGSSIAGRLQGVTGDPRPGGTVLVPRAYVFNLSVNESADGSRIPVRFALRPEESAGRGTQKSSTDRDREIRTANLRAEMETLSLQIREMQRRVEVGALNPLEVRPLQDKYARLERQLAELADGSSAQGSSRPIIDSNFTMDVGETVVVGTSRLGGDKALIALVTAVARSASRR